MFMPFRAKTKILILVLKEKNPGSFKNACCFKEQDLIQPIYYLARNLNSGR